VILEWSSNGIVEGSLHRSMFVALQASDSIDLSSHVKYRRVGG